MSVWCDLQHERERTEALRAERDAALAECERLRGELESHKATADQIAKVLITAADQRAEVFVQRAEKAEAECERLRGELERWYSVGWTICTYSPEDDQPEHPDAGHALIMAKHLSSVAREVVSANEETRQLRAKLTKERAWTAVSDSLWRVVLDFIGSDAEPCSTDASVAIRREIERLRGELAAAHDLRVAALDRLADLLDGETDAVRGERERLRIERDAAVAEAVRVVRERDEARDWGVDSESHAACRAECERLRARVAELEGALRDACPEWLPDMAEKLRTQDTACTAHPVFTVQQRRRHTGIDTQWTDDITWIEDGSECSADRAAELEAEYQRTGDEPDECTRTGYVDEWEHVQSFFTDKAAKDYIAANAHRMCDPRVYVDSAYRNREWQQVVELLLRCDAARSLLARSKPAVPVDPVRRGDVVLEHCCECGKPVLLLPTCIGCHEVYTQPDDERAICAACGGDWSVRGALLDGGEGK